MAIVDGGSFVLAYDHQIASAFAARGVPVDFFGSRTTYNGEFLAAMRALPGVLVHERDVSGSVASRPRGVWAYAALLFEVWRRRREYDAVNLQFSVLWPLELPWLWLLRGKLVSTIHNAVPHGFRGRRHRPTAWIATIARRLVFVSRFSHDDFIARYGERFRAKAELVPHGAMAVVPGLPAVPYVARGRPEALVYWSTVKPYKGIELFLDLAGSDRFKATGLGLEIHGAWDASLAPLKKSIAALGVTIDDRFLDAPALLRLLARNVVFVLPYREASQSGALFSLLHHGRVFLCADVGDLGDFMRRCHVEPLLLGERSADAVLASLERLQRDEAAIVAALQAAQDAAEVLPSEAALARAYRLA